MYRRVVLVAVALSLMAGVEACGSGETETRTVVTVIERQAPSDGEATATTSASEDDLVSDDGAGGGSGGKITVPNEIGKNHQAAQDDLQAHGLYNLSEEDATGQGRMLLLDRNWKVVSQSPEPGTRVSDDATITLRSKKYTD